MERNSKAREYAIKKTGKVQRARKIDKCVREGMSVRSDKEEFRQKARHRDSNKCR
jgi:hypothetical protein